MARMIGYRRFGGAEVLEEGEVSLPAPGEGQVLVKVRAAGINPVDYKLFGGLTRPSRSSAPSFTLPVGSLAARNARCEASDRTSPVS